jgi:membrane protein YdbS with pleckstrin-like domain
MISDHPIEPAEPIEPGEPIEAGEPEELAEPAATKRLVVAGEWRRVSPKYLTVEIVSALIFGVIAIGVPLTLTLLAIWLPVIGWSVLAATSIITLVMLIVAPRRVRSIGYQLRDDDLLFRRGIMFHRVVAVPYGRMQLIDVNRGPVARALGLADLKFVTAAAATGVEIPGLPEPEAEALRDHLVKLAESRRAGL